MMATTGTTRRGGRSGAKGGLSKNIVDQHEATTNKSLDSTVMSDDNKQQVCCEDAQQQVSMPLEMMAPSTTANCSSGDQMCEGG